MARVANKKGLKLTLKEVVIGKQYRISNNRFQAGYMVNEGDLVTVTNKYNNSITVTSAVNGYNFNVMLADLLKPSYTLEEFEKELADLEKHRDETLAKVAWMKDTNSTEYNETEFKIHSVLRTIDGDASEMDKIRAIAKLIS